MTSNFLVLVTQLCELAAASATTRHGESKRARTQSDVCGAVVMRKCNTQHNNQLQLPPNGRNVKITTRTEQSAKKNDAKKFALFANGR